MRRFSRLALISMVAVLAVLAVLLIRPSWHAVPPVPPVPPVPAEPAVAGLVGPIGPGARSCQGVVVTPADNVQDTMDSHPEGTVFCLSAGTYRLKTPLVPKRGDALIGRPGAVLSGSVVLSGWRRDGAAWSTIGALAPPSLAGRGNCLRAMPTCADAEDVFFDKKRLRRVGSRAEVTPGTVYAAHSSDVITIGDNPRAHLVEQAVAPSLIRAAVDDVTVADLVLEEAANNAQKAALETRQSLTPHIVGSRWRILDNEVRLNHGVGIGVADGALVSGNFVHHQGQLGLGVWGRGSTVINNDISFNNTAGYSMEWEAGGTKSWLTESTVMAHNYVHENYGPGLWADGGNAGAAYEYNKVVDNWAGGIEYEISYDAVIAHNEVSGNGHRRKGWGWDAGIEIASSGGIGLIDVHDNVLTDNANGITLIDSRGRAWERPAPYGAHVVQNIWVHRNTITMGPGEYTGAVEDRWSSDVFTSGHNRFEANTYFLNPLAEPHFFWSDAHVGWASWRGSGHDRTGQSRATSQ
jgi:hypothetical protein